ncbi:MAG: hypothetical protein JWO83_160 [Caulobacteraceae bacterium]|jgi:uncharacterized membrane protein|nr:hypothetical protein [Caulobacteraceae bacterium]
MEEPFFMDAVITPHRSMSSKGFIILIGVLTAINAVSAAFFVMIGAGPIPIFLGLDLLAVIVAFTVSSRAARRHERIRVTASEVRVIQASPRGEETVWVSPTAFTRVALVGDAGDADFLRLRLSDRELRVARDLSRPERLAFAKALDRAIWRARSGRVQLAE